MLIDERRSFQYPNVVLIHILFLRSFLTNKGSEIIRKSNPGSFFLSQFFIFFVPLVVNSCILLDT